MKRLLELARKDTRKVLGLMSGTSADAVDAVVVELCGTGRELRWAILSHQHRPYPDDLRRALLDLFAEARSSLPDLMALGNRITREFAAAGAEAVSRAGLSGGGVDLVGSHGQTILHAAPSMVGPERCGSWQLASGPALAEAFDAPTVFDFHSRDMAAGGEGAPLVPYADYIMLADDKVGRMTLNLGGTANVAYLPPDCRPESILAFDTGPGNMVIDELVRIATGGKKYYDEDGRMAAAGRVRPQLLEETMRHPFFRRRPPRATGRQEFGARFATALLGHARHMGLDMSDALAAATALTARSIGEAVRQFVLPRGPLHEVVVSGGGVRNRLLMEMLAAELPKGASLLLSDEFGLPAQAKEAVAHAVLANETLAGNPASLPGTTGAKHPVILGSLVP